MAITYSDEEMESRPDWKHPRGPWHKAPEENGGRWWKVCPFVQVPWETALPQGYGSLESLPYGFEMLFDERPKPESYGGATPEFLKILTQWKDNLDLFIQCGEPPVNEIGLSTRLLNQAVETYEAWGMGKPIYYEAKYRGWQGRFLESKTRKFDLSLEPLILYPHYNVCTYQWQAHRQYKIEFETWHPGLAADLGLDKDPREEEGR